MGRVFEGWIDEPKYLLDYIIGTWHSISNMIGHTASTGRTCKCPLPKIIIKYNNKNTHPLTAIRQTRASRPSRTGAYHRSSMPPNFTLTVLGRAILCRVRSLFCWNRLTKPIHLCIGKLGDCWFLSAMAAVGTKPGLLEKLCVAVRFKFLSPFTTR